MPCIRWLEHKFTAPRCRQPSIYCRLLARQADAIDAARAVVTPTRRRLRQFPPPDRVHLHVEPTRFTACQTSVSFHAPSSVAYSGWRRRPSAHPAGNRRPACIHAAAVAAAGRGRGSVSNGILMGFYRRLCSAARPCPALTDRPHRARDPVAAAGRPTGMCRPRRDPQPVTAPAPTTRCCLRQRRSQQWKRSYRVSPGDAMSARR